MKMLTLILIYGAIFEVRPYISKFPFLLKFI